MTFDDDHIVSCGYPYEVCEAGEIPELPSDASCDTCMHARRRRRLSCVCRNWERRWC